MDQKHSIRTSLIAIVVLVVIAAVAVVVWMYVGDGNTPASQTPKAAEPILTKEQVLESVRNPQPPAPSAAKVKELDALRATSSLMTTAPSAKSAAVASTSRSEKIKLLDSLRAQ